MEPTAGTVSLGASTPASNIGIEGGTRIGKMRGKWSVYSLKKERPTTEFGGARDNGGDGQERAVKRVRGPKEGTEVLCLVKRGNYQVCVSAGKTLAVIYLIRDHGIPCFVLTEEEATQGGLVANVSHQSK